MARQYQLSSLLQTRKKGVVTSKARGGAPIDDPKNAATQEEYDAFNLEISMRVNEDDTMGTVTMTPPLFRLMQQKGDVKKVPFHAEYMAQYGDKPQDKCHRFAQNPDFVSVPDDFEFGSGYHALDDQGDGYKISTDGNILFPNVYYAHNGGFIISCHRYYGMPKTAKQVLEEGTGDILGRRAKIIGKKNETKYLYFIREYQIHRCKPHPISRKRLFYGSHYEMDNGGCCTLDLGSIILTTFVGPRPKGGFIVQHDDDPWNNALWALRWITHSENNLAENRNPMATRNYTKTVLPQVESTLLTDCWYNHPTLPVIVNEAGTHIYHTQQKCFLNIRRYSYRNGWVEHRVSIDGKDYLFARQALKSFLGRALLEGETCEHINCDRDNSSKSNLIPRHGLFQANARKAHKFEVDGKVTGVFLMADGLGYNVHVRLYTPDSYKVSLTLRKGFYATQFDGDLDAANDAAIAFREEHTLFVGMVFV